MSTHAHRHFNSIKVRLEQEDPDEENRILSFQFHKGAIRTTAYLQGIAYQGDFNSIKVRLELCNDSQSEVV